MKLSILILSSLLVFAVPSTPIVAQQITGTPGAPNATTTIDGHVSAAVPATLQRTDRA